MKYEVVTILKDNRPRFLITVDTVRVEMLASKYLKHMDQINAFPNTVRSAAFALSYYYNFLKQEEICAMTICLGIYSFSYWLGRRIVDIEV